MNSRIRQLSRTFSKTALLCAPDHLASHFDESCGDMSLAGAVVAVVLANTSLSFPHTCRKRARAPESPRGGGVVLHASYGTRFRSALMQLSAVQLLATAVTNTLLQWGVRRSIFAGTCSNVATERYIHYLTPGPYVLHTAIPHQTIRAQTTARAYFPRTYEMRPGNTDEEGANTPSLRKAAATVVIKVSSCMCRRRDLSVYLKNMYYKYSSSRATTPRRRQFLAVCR